MQVCIQPNKISGKLTAVPSKSYAHRAIIAAALADASSVIHNVAASDDILATVDVLTGFGTLFSWHGDRLIVQPKPLRTPPDVLNCRDSASTLRFLLPLALYVDGACTFDGNSGLTKRPIDDYIKLFQRHNCRTIYDGKLPLTIEGAPLSGELEISGDVSSQYISGLLMTLPLSYENSTLHLTTALQSRNYVDITLDVLQTYGIMVTRLANGWQVAGKQYYRTTDYTVPGDYSNMAFWLVAGTIGAPIDISGLPVVSLQGDQRIIEIINQMGGNINWDGDVCRALPSRTHGIELDVSQIVDLVPAIALLAAVSNGVTTLYGGKRLRYKESDRIAAVVTQLRSLGAEIIETDDGMIITGKSHLRGGNVDSCGDHRIAMMATIASVACNNTVILSSAQVVNKSYPNFFEHFAAVGGSYEQYNR